MSDELSDFDSGSDDEEMLQITPGVTPQVASISPTAGGTQGGFAPLSPKKGSTATLSPAAALQGPFVPPKGAQFSPKPAVVSDRPFADSPDPLEGGKFAVDEEDDDFGVHQTSDLYHSIQIAATSKKLQSEAIFKIEAEDVDSEDAESIPDSDDALDEEFAIADEDEEQAALEAELAALAEFKTYDEWNALSLRHRMYAFFEPSVSNEVEVPPKMLTAITVYAVIYWVLTLLHLVFFVFKSFPEQFGVSVILYLNYVFLGLTGFHALDFLLRVLLCSDATKIPMIFLDLVTVAAAAIVAVDDTGLVPIGDSYDLVEISYYLVPFKALRLFLVTNLFLHTDTFRDINLVFVTIVSSAKTLSVFLCLLVVGLFIFSTALYLLERGRFDTAKKAWYRPCKDFGGCDEEYSPFQSIPDALWFVLGTMTTVGLGDVIPASTAGRVVTGLAMIAGVFVIAFPTMILVGNLTLVRKNFFREEEIEQRAREDAELALLEEKRAEKAKKEATAMAGFELGSFGSLTGLRNSAGTNEIGTVAVNESLMDGMASPMMSPMMASGEVFPSLSSMSFMKPTRPPADAKTKAYFAFMGDPTREIRVTKNPQVYHYQPILQVLCDEEGLPVLSCIHQISEFRFYVQMSLVIDDRRAQELAAIAVRGSDRFGAPIFCRATPLYGLEVVLATKIPGVKLIRRSDVGEIRDSSIPLTLTLSHDPKTSIPIESRVEQLRKELLGAELKFQCTTQAPSCGLWLERVFLTSQMLSETPFITDLKAICAHVAPDILLTDTQRADRRARDNLGDDELVDRRDFAYASRQTIHQLIRPILLKLVGEKEILQNASEVLNEAVNLITMHCRLVRLQELPESLHRAVYGFNNLTMSDKIYEIDTDFFRTSEWPFGALYVLRSPIPKVMHLRSTVGAAKGCAQPEALSEFGNHQPFSTTISMETTMLKDEAAEKARQIHQEHVSRYAEAARRGEEYRKQRAERDAKRAEAKAVGLASPGNTSHFSDESPQPGSLDPDEREEDEDGLTAEERNQVQQRLMFGS
jgi:hypothetical protein